MKIKVKNPKWQAKLDAITGWKEIGLVFFAVVITAAVVMAAWKAKLL